jgi:hypothetical protein
MSGQIVVSRAITLDIPYPPCKFSLRYVFISFRLHTALNMQPLFANTSKKKERLWSQTSRSGDWQSAVGTMLQCLGLFAYTTSNRVRPRDRLIY